MKKDGWILVQHPDMGLLLQALSDDVEETAPPMPNPPEGWRWCGRNWRKSESTKSFTVDVFVLQKWCAAVWTHCNYVQLFSSCNMHPMNEALLFLIFLASTASPDWTGCLLGWKGCFTMRVYMGGIPICGVETWQIFQNILTIWTLSYSNIGGREIHHDSRGISLQIYL